MTDLVLQTMRECDHAFVMDNWLESYRKAPSTHRLPNGVYYKRQRRIIERLLGHSTVHVARPHDWPEGLLGWLCAEQCDGVFILHYGYVKATRRRMGIANALLKSFAPQGRMVFTHLRPPYTDLLRNKGFSHAPHYAGVRLGASHG